MRFESKDEEFLYLLGFMNDEQLREVSRILKECKGRR